MTFLTLLLAIATALVVDGSLEVRDAYTLKMNRSVWSEPRFASGLLVVGSYDKSLTAVNALTGAAKWQVISDNSIRADVAVSASLGKVVDATLSGLITCRDLRTGATLWKHQRKSFTWVFSPVIHGAVVFVPSRNDDLIALSMTNGSLLLTIPGTSGVWSGPVVIPASNQQPPAEGQIVVAITAGAMVASFEFQSNGSNEGLALKKDRTWKHDIVPGATHYKQRQHAWIFGSPAVVHRCCGDSSIIVFGANDRTVRAVDALSGSAKWLSRVRGRVSSTPVVVKGSDGTEYPVILSENGDVVCLGSTGDVRWQSSLRQPAASSVSPSVLNNVVVAGGTRGGVVGYDGHSGDVLFQETLAGCSVRSAPGLMRQSRSLWIAVGCDNGLVRVVVVDGVFPASTIESAKRKVSINEKHAVEEVGSAVTAIAAVLVGNNKNDEMPLPTPLPLVFLACLSCVSAAAFYVRRSSLRKSKG